MTGILEIIRLSSVQQPLAHVQRAIAVSLEAVDGPTPQVRLYENLRQVGHVCVYLRHTSADDVAQCCHLGLRLAEALRSYGVVEHSVWADVTATRPSR